MRPAYCSASECDRPVRSGGLCSMHYQRLRRTGSLDRYGNRERSEERACEACGAAFMAEPNQIKQGAARFCSYECKYQADRGVEKAHGTRYVRKDGYVAVKVGIRRYELEHRLVAGRMLGRGLATEEHVHHINGDKQDNRPENLMVLTNEEHQAIHNHPQTRSRRVTLTCNYCGGSYQRKASRAAESRFCSNGCRFASLRSG